MFVEQQRAKEVVEWRSVEEQRLRLEEEQSAIQQKQQHHLEQYRKERAGLDHLSWRQRKAALYRANRSSFSRPSERRRSQELKLPIIIKGTCTRLTCCCKACWERTVCVSVWTLVSRGRGRLGGCHPEHGGWLRRSGPVSAGGRPLRDGRRL